MRPNLPFVSAKHTLVTYNITLSLITKINQGPRCFQRQTRKVILAFCRVAHRTVRCATGQSGAPPDSQCRRSGADLLSFLAQATVAAPGQLAHRTVRCPLPTVGAGHASPADYAADRCAGDRWLTGQSDAPPDSPVNYSRTPPIFPESGLFTGGWPSAPDIVWCTTGQSGVPSRAGLWLYQAKSFVFLFFSSFLCF
jgi:hypothetical protein